MKPWALNALKGAALSIDDAGQYLLIRLPKLLLACLLVTSSAYAQDSQFVFDVSEFEKKAFELGGYAELAPEYDRLNQDGAAYQLQYFGKEQRTSVEQLPGILELEGYLRKAFATFSFRTHSEATWDYRGARAEHDLYEGLLSLQPEHGLTFDIGKKAYRWGKGYAWSPVAFVERPKNASEPDLSREGYWVAGADWIQTFDGPLQTLAITPLILPVDDDINSDFGETGHTNIAAKLYLLYRDTDLDFMFVSKGSRGARYGMDFAKNLAPNFEIHGEFAYLEDVGRNSITPDCQAGPKTSEDATSYLLGLRYRTNNDITTILEYYHNGAGNDKADQQQFYECVHRAWDENDQEILDGLPVNTATGKSPFTRPNPMRNYMNLKVWWKEPNDILYLTPAFQLLYNLDDSSYSVSPEVTYRAYGNLEIRLRAAFPFGDQLTEWGEKLTDYKVQLRVRYHF